MTQKQIDRAADKAWKSDWREVYAELAALLLPPPRPVLRGWQAIMTLEGK